MRGLILITAGGTGGHVFPAQALAAELASRGRRHGFITDSRGAEFHSGEVYRVSAGAVSGRGVIGRLRGLAAVAFGVFEARRLLRRLRPAGVVGFGGYASVPAMLAAVNLGLPTVIHEQNAVLGRANRLLAPRVGAVATAFTDVGRLADTDRAKTRHTGNPVRPAMAALARTPYPAPQTNDSLSILVTGGSQGAAVMTQVVPGALSSLPGPPRHRFRVVQQCRPEQIDAARAIYQAAGIEAELATFFDDMPDRLAAAQLVIARAGASTVAELTAAGRPAILVPYPSATDDHQTANARAIDAAGGGWLVAESDFTVAGLAARIGDFLDHPGRLIEAAAKALALGIPDAAGRLATLVEDCMPAIHGEAAV
jgi:UDP-N-acetylglucosamine--N-acetylmuramyl-(pentapeptide) pyrophosphoryl-undecaprenol N-acetylglucosamine transferase